MDTRVSQREDFMIDTLPYWEPMKCFENRGNVVRDFLACDDPSGCILNSLKATDLCGW